MIQQWQESHTLLTTAVSRFCDSSTLLEQQCTSQSGNSGDLISRIDSSLDYLQSTLHQQLTLARVSLAQTRNRLARSAVSLPQEILCEIFRHVVYDPTDEDDPSAVMISMERRVEKIYRRLYSLLGVCTAWWRTGLDCKALWSVIPVNLGRRPQSTTLALQRTGSNGLVLALSLPLDTGRIFDALATHLSRFSVINISSNFLPDYTFITLLKMILRNGTSECISSISIKYCRKEEEIIHWGKHATKPFDTFLAALEPQFYQLVGSLSVLRLGALALNWGRTTFSDRLVVLQLSGISLGRQPGIDAFIAALSSAYELRDLKLISIQGVPNITTHIPVGDVSILPHLESLYIEDLCLSMFSIFMTFITPGSYHLTLNLYPSLSTSYFTVDGTPDIRATFASYAQVCAILRLIKIDKLIICMDESNPWSSATGLRALLKSVPKAQTIVMNSYHLDMDILRAFRQPPRPPSWESTRDDLFPKLEVIEFHCSTIESPLGDLKKDIKYLLASHPVRRMVLGVHYHVENEAPLDEDNETIVWLKATVPEFYLFPEQHDPPEKTIVWQLWDV
ncbi:hypothetical protein RSOL_374740, partial [Rhizoctonia solani AG-3 Rhs1AP]